MTEIAVTNTIRLINELAQQIHENAVAKGFYDDVVLFPQSIALIHSEASEALEAHREGEGVDRITEELADIIIRVLDTCSYHNLNIGASIVEKMDKNKKRAQKHGKRY
jgi:NTP pyrophosphatase (non-canonical NTP hydrolase)